MRLLVDIRFVPLDGKPNIIKFEQVSSFSNPNYKMRKLVLLGTFAKLRIATFSFVMSVSPSVRVSVSPHGTTWLPLDGFSWNLKFGKFSNSYRENSSSNKIRQEQRVVYMKIVCICCNSGNNIAKLFIEWESISGQTCRENKNQHFKLPFFFPKIAPFMRQCGKILEFQTGHRWQYGACASHAGNTLRICNT